jgi:hypothetical protein
MSESLFKSRRQSNRDLINESLKHTIDKLKKRLKEVEKTHVVETNSTDPFEVPESRGVVVRITPSTPITKKMKVFISVVSSDSMTEGISYYLRDYKENDTCLMIVVENTTEIVRHIKINYLITE